MGLMELLWLAVGLSMDAFAVSVCKGLAMGRITVKNGLLCGIWFGGFQGLMPFIGYLLGTGFEKYIDKVAPWVAFILLGCIGGNMLRETLTSRDEEEEVSAGLDVKTMFLMAVATSIDALAVGITFVGVPPTVVSSLGVLINVVISVCIIGVTTFVLSMIGVKVGNVFGTKFKAKAEIAGGVILILLGLRILLEQLL